MGMNKSNKIRWTIVAAPVVAAILAAFVAFGAMHQSSHSAEAVNPVTVGIDMKTTSSDPGTYSTLPKFENCVDVKTNVNSHFYIDIFVLNATSLIGDIADVTYTSGKMQIEQANVKQFLGSAANNYSEHVAGDGVSISPPDSDGTFEAYGVDLGGTHSGNGVLVRLYAQAYLPPSGGIVIPFAFSTAASHGVTLSADNGSGGTIYPGDTNGDGIFDGPFINGSTAKIAVVRLVLDVPPEKLGEPPPRWRQ
jgi:hypothetical protein